MIISNIFIALAIGCAMWNVVASLMIYRALKKQGYPVNFLLLRLLAPKYAFEYKKITKSETGRAGSLFYQWIFSINMALVFALVGILYRI